MSKGVHLIRSKSRRFRCDLAGCRNFTNILVTKRGDVSARPIHLCEECITGIYDLLTAEQTSANNEAVEQTKEEIVLPEIPVEPEQPHIKPEKSEAKPNKARKNPNKKSV